MTALDMLQQKFGYPSFRNGQADLIAHILQGQDVLGIMPTGAGKSICYQIPALLLPGLTIVITPLISLMQDQVTALQNNQIPAMALNSMTDAETYREIFRCICRRELKILYVSPERLETPGFCRLVKEIPVSMVAVDEAHCVSQWGQDFRPSYLSISFFLQSLPVRPIVSAFTATATQVVAEDIIRILQMHRPFSLSTGFNRKNLFFAVDYPKDKFHALVQILHAHPGESGIVYCISRKMAEQITKDLQRNGFSAACYHAGLCDETRRQNQQDFLYDTVKIMVATNAFGMGIDKSNINFVVHYHMPKDLESYYQEAGRAGRDGSNADCILFYHPGDVRKNIFLIEKSGENTRSETEKMQLQQRDKDRLWRMRAYCTEPGCLRRHMLRYFGEDAPEYCGNCSFCRANAQEQDITLEAQKIISCIYKLQQQEAELSAQELAAVLHGSVSPASQRYAQLSTYGIMKELPVTRCCEIIKFMVSENWISRSPDGCLHVNRNSALLLKEKKKIAMYVKKTTSAQNRSSPGTTTEHSELMQLLKQCRQELAQKEHVPAYVIFTDATLRDMCKKLPVSSMGFRGVDGVGYVKLEKYGEAFLSVIRDYEKHRTEVTE